VADLTFASVAASSPMRMSNPKPHFNPIFAGVPSVLTFVRLPAAIRCECQNRDACGCIGHPAFPAPSLSRDTVLQKPGRNSRCGIEDLWPRTRKIELFDQPSFVPAKAGSHNHRCEFAAKNFNHCARRKSPGVWVPAFAGTTEERGHCEEQSDDAIQPFFVAPDCFVSAHNGRL